ncbi:MULTISPECIES: Mov34/MPN/PAD-1 family protein [Alphaproteobacteria]|jgi:integrative and conjugative element protein (TIGR02256 family)|uniref:Mov34/MPN/PAD-1 family protein n=1 Tax=Alphaproteobacteria TaxID=28211 RepID=UPI000C978A0B|nr:Mov34/MPN/PAD-1 family protein [Parvibaculum sp.]MAB12490.1 hypothetical protein [Parvibaculum sp.]MDY6799207.1 Mov34/MPN/PAD-1 family protein [Pseudomonadota bacterium]
MKIEFPASLRRRMRRRLWWAGRREIGGILMAEQIAPGHFRLADFSVDDQTGGAAHFVRSTEYHQAALRSFFARTGDDYRRYNYLGEWHSHPRFPVIPSVDDCCSMRELVESERSIDFAILLISKTRLWTPLECSALLFQKGEEAFRVEVNYCE